MDLEAYTKMAEEKDEADAMKELKIKTFIVATSSKNHTIKATNFSEHNGILQLISDEGGNGAIGVDNVKAIFPACKWDSCIEIEDE